MNSLKGFRNLSYFFIIFILIFLLIPIHFSYAESYYWDDSWSYQQEILITFDTSLEIAKFQPIDITIEFENLCWAKNEKEHSIRIIYQKSKTFIELESQIYNLNFSDEEYINSCSLVFLIPKEADGSEQYFIYYDDSKKSYPDYIDHVNIEESYYFYEPIPGYSLESHYYKLLDDNYLAYGVSQKGQFMGYNTAQHVTKMKDNITEPHPKNGELFAAFDFKYCYEPGLFGYSSTSQKLVSKEILIDGNLMLEFGITSTSKLDDLQTTATYKYYHCPGSNSRIHVHVKHETLKEIKVLSDTNTDGTYASLQIGGVKSKSIKELNIGEILPFMHFTNEQDTIEGYPLEIDPEYIPENPDIRIIRVLDEMDLGKNAWMSFDEGETGISHSVIFNSNNVLLKGTDEKDGIQLNAFQMDYPHLPGLENNIATMQLSRNSYEKSEQRDLIIPDDFVAEFDAEFFSSKTDGYSIVENEAEIFRELINIKPVTDGKFIDEPKEIEKHDLSVRVHFASSAPLGSSLSALLGINFSYVNVELYKDDEFRFSSNAVRLPMDSIDDFDTLSLIEKIKAIITSFQWGNITFTKTARFQEVEEGIYVVKIFKENPPITKERKFIGYAIIDLKNDINTRVLCRDEKSVDITIKDQNNKNVDNAEVSLQFDELTISKGITDENGHAIIKAPWQSEPYNLKVTYKNLVVYENPVKLNILDKIIPIKKSINLERYNLILNIKDTWELPPQIKLYPMLLNNNSEESSEIYAEKQSQENYIFSNIPQGSYQLKMKYKSFTVEKNITITEDSRLDIEFPAEFQINLKISDSRGNPYDNARLTISRDNKEIKIQKIKSETMFSLPPGTYHVKIFNDDLIAARSINVFSNKNYDVITDQESLYPALLIIFAFIVLGTAGLLSFTRKNKMILLYIIPISLVIISLALPWWAINGSSSSYETTTNMYIVPTELITITSNANILSGETAYLPDIFKDAIFLIPIMTITGCILIISLIYLEKSNRKKLRSLASIFSLIVFAGSFLLFTIGMSQLLEVGVGSLVGEGYLDISVPGEGASTSIFCSWGPAYGFYIYLAAIAILFILFLNIIFKNRNEEKLYNKDNDKKGKRTIQHPLFGISTSTWLQILNKNKGVDNKYFYRGIFITLMSIFTTPARLLFKIKYGSKIKNTDIKHTPVFIIGHWRSGTTYLHELLGEDPQFCYVSLWNTLLPDSFLVLEPIKKLLSGFLPKQRPMDSIEVEIDGPYEEEAGIAVINQWSFFHGLHFPKNAEEQYLKSIHYQGLSDDERSQWKNNYHHFMKTVTYANQGKRLLLKDPANTARIPLLLELFPDAKFIHIIRNPYKVYLSTIKMRNKVLDKLALQEADEKEIEKQVIKNYKRLMNAYFEQKKLIPKENLVEIKYEDLVSNPIKQVKNIYLKLKLPGFNKALPGINKYLERKKDYRVNVYKIDEKILQHIKDNWNFTIKRWGYKPPNK